ncbi:MAG: DUF4349 domain-containing protein [Cyclobacteriaceae bacterium]
MKNAFYIVILMIGFLSCGESETDAVLSEEEIYADLDLKMPEEMAEVVVTGYAGSANAVQLRPISANAQQKLIKTAYLTLQVEDIESSYSQFHGMIEKYGGFIANDNYQNYPERKSRSLTIRVDSEHLETLLTKMAESGGYVENRSINISDVTEEFVDVEIRLKNKRAVRDQYIKLLERADKVEDILKIENELRVIREEIEAKEGRLRYLKDQVALSTIHLELYQEVILAAAPPSKGFFIEVYENLKAGWMMIIDVFLFIIKLWPLMIIAGIAVFIIRKFRRPQLSQ